MNFFIYRKPGENETEGAMSDSLLSGLHADSFAVAPFDGSEEHVFSIPNEKPISPADLDIINSIDEDSVGKSAYTFPDASTVRRSHRSMVEHIISDIESGRLTKCVAARAIVREGDVSLAESFRRLCEAYPNAFVACFHTAPTGTWLCATPERLLSRRGDRLLTMSLAGTRPADAKRNDTPWDAKNIEEQKIVTDFITETLAAKGLMTATEGPVTYNAGPVEHLMTRIEATGNGITLAEAAKTAMTLSPTPALSGLPRQAAVDAIAAYEDFERGYYGGFIGPVYADGDFDFFVNLRSALIEKERYCIFAGGGIVKGSEPDTEWAETERKSTTLTDVLRINAAHRHKEEI